jgi:protein-tyrosine phosphatase
MTDPDDTARPRLRRADLRRLRDSLERGEDPLSDALMAVPGAQAQPARAFEGPPQGTILTVCTGNICRSPMGEVLLHAQLRDLGVRVHSGGTHALVDHEMTEQAQQLAVVNGADAADAAAHRARLLTEKMLAESDLVLAMAREHRSYVVQLSPALLRRTFTVREFARLAATLTDDEVRQGVAAAGADAGARLRALAQLVGGQRGMVPADPDNDDVIDPYRRSQTTYELSTSQLAPAVAEVTRAIRATLEPSGR